MSDVSPIGSAWSRRRLLRTGGLFGVSLAGGLSLAACSVTTPTSSSSSAPATTSGASAGGASTVGTGTPNPQFPVERWNPHLAAAAKPTGPRRIGFLNTLAGNSLNGTFSGAVYAAAKLSNLEVIESNPQGDTANGINQSRAMIKRGIVGFFDTQALKDMQPVNLEAMKAGAAVVQFNQGPVTSSLYSIQYEGGHALGVYTAKYIKEKLGGKAKIAFISQDFGETLKARGVGFKDALAEAGISDQLVSYVTPPTANGATQPAGVAAMNTILQQHPDVNVVAGAADDQALGAVSALNAAGKTGANFMACGIDGTQQGLDFVSKQNSTFKCTVAVNFPLVGYAPAMFFGRWADGLTIPQVQVFNYFTIDSADAATKFAKDGQPDQLARVFQQMVDGDNSYITPLGTISYATRDTYYNGDMVLKLPTLKFNV